MDSDRSGQGSPGKRLKIAETSDPPPVLPPTYEEEVEDENEEGLTELAEVDPMYGSLFVLGRSREVVDTISTKTSLCSPKINRRLPVHFFAVFDSHDDYPVSRLCREWMHALVEEELLRVGNNGVGGNNGSSSSLGLQDIWEQVMKSSFVGMNAMALIDSTSESHGEECRQSLQWELCEADAVVAILTRDYIVVATCGGGARAVLCRGGTAIPLSAEHEEDTSEDTSDELDLITPHGAEEAGGNPETWRAMREESPEPIVIGEPEVTFTNRVTEDECLIVATDGLWEVMTSEVACQVACECLRQGDRARHFIDLPREYEGNNSLSNSRCFHAASVLTRLALGMKSYDNISVIVIDLKSSTRN